MEMPGHAQVVVGDRTDSNRRDPRGAGESALVRGERRHSSSPTTSTCPAKTTRGSPPARAARRLRARRDAGIAAAGCPGWTRRRRRARRIPRAAGLGRYARRHEMRIASAERPPSALASARRRASTPGLPPGVRVRRRRSRAWTQAGARRTCRPNAGRSAPRDAGHLRSCAGGRPARPRRPGRPGSPAALRVSACDGSRTRPMNRIAPVCASRMRNMNGRSKRSVLCFSGNGDPQPPVVSPMHRGRGRGLRARLVDVDVGLVDHVGDEHVAASGDPGEVGECGVDGVAHAHRLEDRHEVGPRVDAELRQGQVRRRRRTPGSSCRRRPGG